MILLGRQYHILKRNSLLGAILSDFACLSNLSLRWSKFNHVGLPKQCLITDQDNKFNVTWADVFALCTLTNFSCFYILPFSTTIENWPFYQALQKIFQPKQPACKQYLGMLLPISTVVFNNAQSHVFWVTVN